MAVSESQRHELYARLEEVIGKEHAETIMSLLPPVGWADVATKHDLEQLEARMELRFQVVHETLASMESRLEDKMESLESGMNERIIRTALVVNIPTILASFALAFTAVRL